MSVYSLVITTGKCDKDGNPTKNGDHTVTGSGTDANVHVILYNRYGQTWSVVLNSLLSGNVFEAGDVDTVALPDDIVDMGDIEALQIGHNNKYGNPGWFLNDVVVNRIVNGTVRSQTFPCNK